MRLLALAVAGICFGLGSNSHAQQAGYGRVVTFGDSLSDSGNEPPLPGYYRDTTRPAIGGRSSNGPVWSEILAGKPGPNGESSQAQLSDFLAGGVLPSRFLNGSVNFAFGGARVDTVPNSLSPMIPGVKTQIGAYVQIYEANFKATGRFFKADDLVTIEGGNNNYIQDLYKAAAIDPSKILDIRSLSATDRQSLAGVIAADPNFSAKKGIEIAGLQGENLASLARLGAPTVLVSNLPNLAEVPSFRYQEGAFPALQTASNGAAYTIAYNNALNANVRQIAAQSPSTNFIQLDWFALNNIITASPGKFGFDNITDACVRSAACVATNAKGYLYWDDIHPSAAYHQLVADYASLLLSTGESSRSSQAILQSTVSTTFDATDVLFNAFTTTVSQGRNGLYAEVTGQQASFDGNKSNVYGRTGYNYDLEGFRAGLNTKVDDVWTGMNIAYQTGNLKGRAIAAPLENVSVAAYGLVKSGLGFAGIEGGFSKTSYDGIKRFTGFPTIYADSSTDTLSYTAAATAGTELSYGRFTVTPAFRVGYASFGVDGFAESAPILALDFADREVNTGFWTIRLKAVTPLPVDFKTGMSLFAETGYEGLFLTDTSHYDVKLVNNTARPVSALGDAIYGRGYFLKAGIESSVLNDIKVAVQYDLSLNDGAGTVQGGRLKLSIPTN